MGEQIEKEVTEVEITDGFLATYNLLGQIRVMDEDGELLFLLPKRFPIEWINDAIYAYQKGTQRGYLSGVREQLATIRRALGL